MKILKSSKSGEINFVSHVSFKFPCLVKLVFNTYFEILQHNRWRKICFGFIEKLLRNSVDIGLFIKILVTAPTAFVSCLVLNYSSSQLKRIIDTLSRSCTLQCLLHILDVLQRNNILNRLFKFVLLEFINGKNGKRQSSLLRDVFEKILSNNDTFLQNRNRKQLLERIITILNQKKVVQRLLLIVSY